MLRRQPLVHGKPPIRNHSDDLFVDDVAQASLASSGGGYGLIVHQQPFRCKSLKLMGFLHFNRNRNTGNFMNVVTVVPVLSSNLIVKTGLRIKNM
ncbi:hypothetical protein AGR1C_pAt40099 [Agrobacterium fabacearum TT111]|nr:hypothetical protein AGR1C_pAt40099 [Agrobacterium fabacearum TT111]